MSDTKRVNEVDVCKEDAKKLRSNYNITSARGYKMPKFINLRRSFMVVVQYLCYYL